jgi:hypothetical protein
MSGDGDESFFDSLTKRTITREETTELQKDAKAKADSNLARRLKEKKEKKAPTIETADESVKKEENPASGTGLTSDESVKKEENPASGTGLTSDESVKKEEKPASGTGALGLAEPKLPENTGLTSTTSTTAPPAAGTGALGLAGPKLPENPAPAPGAPGSAPGASGMSKNRLFIKSLGNGTYQIVDKATDQNVYTMTRNGPEQCFAISSLNEPTTTASGGRGSTRKNKRRKRGVKSRAKRS